MSVFSVMHITYHSDPASTSRQLAAEQSNERQKYIVPLHKNVIFSRHYGYHYAKSYEENLW